MTGALIGAGGVSIISVLTLRAMGEWNAVSDRDIEPDEGDEPDEPDDVN